MEGAAAAAGVLGSEAPPDVGQASPTFRLRKSADSSVGKVGKRNPSPRRAPAPVVICFPYADHDDAVLAYGQLGGKLHGNKGPEREGCPATCR